MNAGDKENQNSWLRELLDRHERPLLAYALRLTGNIETARDVVQDTIIKALRERAPHNGDSRDLDASDNRNSILSTESPNSRDEKPSDHSGNHTARWLFTVCRNRAMDERRRERRMKSIASPLPVADASYAHDPRDDSRFPIETRSNVDSGSGPPCAEVALARHNVPQVRVAAVPNASEITASPAAALELHETATRALALVAGLPPNQQEVLRLKFQAGLSYKEIAAVMKLTVSNVGFLIHTAIKTLRENLT